MLAVAQKTYAHVVVDLPAAHTTDTLAVACQSDMVYLTCSHDAASLHLARSKAERLLRVGLAAERLALLVNRASQTQPLDSIDISRISNLPVRAMFEDDSNAVRRANWLGGLVDPESKLGRQLQNFGAEILADLRQATIAEYERQDVHAAAVAV